jgi:anti-anti-sigma factor
MDHQEPADTNPSMTFLIGAEDAETTIVTIRGELDISNVDELDAAMATVIDRRVDRLILDVGELEFADSSAIAVWVRWAAAVGEFRLRRVSPLLRTVIVTMGLSCRLRIER